MDGPGGRRSAARQPLLLPAAVMSLQRSSTIIVVDVSSTSARLRGESLPQAGQDVLIRVGLVERLATAVWADEGLCGIRFDVPLDEQELDHLQREARYATLSRLTPEERLAAEDWLTGCARWAADAIE